MLTKRIITSLCGLPILIAAIWFEEFLPWFTMLVALLAALAALEYANLVGSSKRHIFAFYLAVMSFMFALLRDVNILEIIDQAFNASYIFYLLLASLILPFIWSWLYARRFGIGKSWEPGLFTVAGLLVTGWALSHLVALRGIDDGRNWVFFALFVTFAYDTFAYFIGRSFGNHKMVPRISPGKSWEGAAGGLAGAILVSLFFTLSTPLELSITWWHALVLALLISIFGQAGDLLESWFKRFIGVKDSGSLLPGHGGLLDRLDSVVFTGVVVYYYVIWVIL
ncbi:MAG: phosphatidate cytidylyltransferase [Dehalococcoidales bacterium]|nr:phosphatidate cytidylyltransferase [Dehalococcoidales bacterium]